MHVTLTRPAMVATVLLILSSSMVAVASQPTAFDQMAEHYEEIRQALLHDNTTGIADHAKRIEHLAGDLQRSFDATSAGVSSDHVAECLELLPSVREAASGLTAAETVEDAREAFDQLSQSMIRYRQMTAQPKLVVAYCSMKKKAWMQPKGEIGNPYFGQEMARCGEVISE